MIRYSVVCQGKIEKDKVICAGWGRMEDGGPAVTVGADATLRYGPNKVGCPICGSAILVRERVSVRPV